MHFTDFDKVHTSFLFVQDHHNLKENACCRQGEYKNVVAGALFWSSFAS